MTVVSHLLSLTTADGRLTGYGLARNGTAAVYVGPVLATNTKGPRLFWTDCSVKCRASVFTLI